MQIFSGLCLFIAFIWTEPFKKTSSKIHIRKEIRARNAEGLKIIVQQCCGFFFVNIFLFKLFKNVTLWKRDIFLHQQQLHSISTSLSAARVPGLYTRTTSITWPEKEMVCGLSSHKQVQKYSRTQQDWLILREKAQYSRTGFKEIQIYLWCLKGWTDSSRVQIVHCKYDVNESWVLLFEVIT